jgi:hypothetical protein
MKLYRLDSSKNDLGFCLNRGTYFKGLVLIRAIVLVIRCVVPNIPANMNPSVI